MQHDNYTGRHEKTKKIMRKSTKELRQYISIIEHDKHYFIYYRQKYCVRTYRKVLTTWRQNSRNTNIKHLCAYRPIGAKFSELF